MTSFEKGLSRCEKHPISKSGGFFWHSGHLESIYVSLPPEEKKKREEKKGRMGIMSVFTSLFRITLFRSHHPSASCSSSEGILALPCIEGFNPIYLDCCCVETGLEEIEVFRE
ncbi:hypothetical protein TMatcc_010709 [Talaromyces marneffei ATCC 18224]